MITFEFNNLVMMLLAASLTTCGVTVSLVAGLCTTEVSTKTIKIISCITITLTILLFSITFTADITHSWLKYTPYSVEYCSTKELESIKKELTNDYKKALKTKYVLKKIYYYPITKTTRLVLFKKYLILETDTI